MLDRDQLTEKMAQIEQTLQTQEMILKTLRDGLAELKEQSVYYYVLEELRQLKKALGQYHIEYPDEFALLKDAVEKGEWPLAADSGSICETEAHKEHRAENIIQFVIVDYLKDRKFLDFGCGEGHTVFAANKQGTNKAIGYDIKPFGWDRFEQDESKLLTTEWNKVVDNGPYDVILMFDVLDHAEMEDPIQLLKKARDVLTKNGKLYVKCHPWSSRHGSHIYEQNVNKAFAHLIFDEVELTRIFGTAGRITLPVTHPIQTYNDWFKDAAWEIESEYVSRTKVEKFFMKKELHDRIAKHYPSEEDKFEKYISIDFVDYVLTPKEYQIF